MDRGDREVCFVGGHSGSVSAYLYHEARYHSRCRYFPWNQVLTHPIFFMNPGFRTYGLIGSAYPIFPMDPPCLCFPSSQIFSHPAYLFLKAVPILPFYPPINLSNRGLNQTNFQSARDWIDRWNFDVRRSSVDRLIFLWKMSRFWSWRGSSSATPSTLAFDCYPRSDAINNSEPEPDVPYDFGPRRRWRKRKPRPENGSEN